MELRLVEEYIMLLQTQNGGMVIVDTRPALIMQAKEIHLQIMEWLEAHSYKPIANNPKGWHIITAEDWQEFKEGKVE